MSRFHSRDQEVAGSEISSDPWLRVVVVAGLLLAFAAATSSGQSAETRGSSAAEFPPYDAQVWRLLAAGLNAKAASARTPQAAVRVETLGILVQQRRADEALQLLRTIIDSHPEQMARAFEIATRDFSQLTSARPREVPDAIRELVALGRNRLPDLPREEAARAARQILSVESSLSPAGSAGYAAALDQFTREYSGTEAALVAEVDQIASRNRLPGMLGALDTFIAGHPESVAGAKALYTKGFQLQSNMAITGVEPRGADPTDRFMKVLDIVKELESGRYPACEWTGKAPSLVIGFFAAREAVYSPGNIDKVLGAYQDFVRTHFSLDETDPLGNGIGYVVTSKMADLCKRKGDPVGGMESALTDLEQHGPDPDGARFLRALFYMSLLRSASPTDRPGLFEKARDTLASLHATAEGLYQRKALATLASLYLDQRDFPNARLAYKKYVDRYPQSPYAWVAALRIGGAVEEQGEWKTALDSYRAAAAQYGAVPVARVLGHAYAARSCEALDRFDNALTEYERALAGWDNAFGQTYSLYSRPKPNEPFPKDEAQVVKEELTARVSQLKRFAGQPGAPLLERGRWLLDRGRQREAQAALADVLKRFPKSPVAPEARTLSHRATFEDALELAGIENANADEAAAVKALEGLAREPYDFYVCAAKIARSLILLKHGARADAETLMMKALDEHRSSQAAAVGREQRTGIEQDVEEIRSVVFRPAGGGVFEKSRWNAFTWSEAGRPFAVVNPEVRVSLAGGDVVRMSAFQRFPAAESVLFLTTGQIAVLSDAINKLGGTGRRQPRAIMETPNQPVGPSVDLIAFLDKFFPARPGHWGGWVFETFPIVGEIVFTNAERTKALARVTVGYSGCDVVLEKENGTWKARELVNQWIT